MKLEDVENVVVVDFVVLNVVVKVEDVENVVVVAREVLRDVLLEVANVVVNVVVNSLMPLINQDMLCKIPNVVY